MSSSQHSEAPQFRSSDAQTAQTAQAQALPVQTLQADPLQTSLLQTNLLQADVRSLQRLLTQQKQQLAAQRSEDFGFEWRLLSPAVGLLHDPLRRNGWSHTGYLGFATKREATAQLKQLQRLTARAHPAQARYQLRKARRLPAYRWEIKATDINPAILETLTD